MDLTAIALHMCGHNAATPMQAPTSKGKNRGRLPSALSTYIVRVVFGSGGLGQPAPPTPTESGQATGSAGDSRRYTESVTLAFKFDEALAWPPNLGQRHETL